MTEKLTAEQVVERLLKEAGAAYAWYQAQGRNYDNGLHDGLKSAAELVRKHLCDKEASA